MQLQSRINKDGEITTTVLDREGERCKDVVVIAARSGDVVSEEVLDRGCNLERVREER